MNNYFYIDLNGVQHGPLSLNQLITQQCLLPETMVWNNTLVDWQRADSVDELKECFVSSNGEMPPPPSSFTNEPTYEYDSFTYVTYEDQKKPRTWLVWNILSVVFCCGIIPGLVGIIYSNKVDSYWAMGRYEEAKSASNTARIMFFISLGFCIAGILWPIGSFLGLFGFSDQISIDSYSSPFYPF